jgi:hypothetical protein
MRFPKEQFQEVAYRSGWTAREEFVIATIQQAESVPLAEAIRRMQRRKKASMPVVGRPAVPTTQRLCRNSRCTGGR